MISVGQKVRLTAMAHDRLGATRRRDPSEVGVVESYDAALGRYRVKWQLPREYVEALAPKFIEEAT